MNQDENNKKNPMYILKEHQQKTVRKAKQTVAEYKSFAIKGNVIDMAIGVVIGSAFTNIVNTIVSSTITPIISLLTNKVDLSTLFISLTGGHYATLEEAKNAGAITLNYGTLLNAVLNFLIISIVLFIIIRFIKKLDKKDATKEEAVKKVTTKTCPYCISTVPIEATKCAFCTSDLVNDTPVKKQAKRKKLEK